MQQPSPLGLNTEPHSELANPLTTTTSPHSPLVLLVKLLKPQRVPANNLVDGVVGGVHKDGLSVSVEAPAKILPCRREDVRGHERLCLHVCERWRSLRFCQLRALVLVARVAAVNLKGGLGNPAVDAVADEDGCRVR